MYHLKNLCITLIICSTLLAGCGGNMFEGLADDSSEEAQKEAAKIALDKGEYALALSQLEALCGADLSSLTCDAETKSDYASAYMGGAGLDALRLIEVADSLVDQGTTESDFTTFSQLLPDQSPENVEKMYNAVTILSSIPSEERTENQNLQLATAAVSSLILTVGALTEGFDPETGLPIRDFDSEPITISELEEPASSIGVPATGSIGDTALSETTTIVEAAAASLIAAVDAGADIGVATTEQITDIKSEMDNDDSGSISSTELRSYLNTTLN